MSDRLRGGGWNGTLYCSSFSYLERTAPLYSNILIDAQRARCWYLVGVELIGFGREGDEGQKEE